MTTYKLTIFDRTSTGNAINGTEEVMREAMDLFTAFMGNPVRDENELLKVEGFTDTADRAPYTLIMRMDHVVSMILVRMWGNE